MGGYRPNSTAMGAAVMRAAHHLLDQSPFILEDAYAFALSGLSEAAVRGAVARMEAEFSTLAQNEGLAARIVCHVRASILLRNRFAEDQLERAMQRGVTQYVMLGAGLDTFVLRRPDLAGRLDIYEVDLPELLAWKEERLGQMGHPLSPCHHFVPGDLENCSVQALLQEAGVAMERPVFFSWLGVTGYLREAAIRECLGDMARMAAGSWLVLSYGLRADHVAGDGAAINRVLKAMVAARGEPVANEGFIPAEMARLVREAGFSQVEDFSVAMAQAHYFDGREDELSAPAMIHMMTGRV